MMFQRGSCKQREEEAKMTEAWSGCEIQTLGHS